MGILGSILGKRDTGMPYRTVDGGHPAPYPDMTDQQLYNYELAFEVPRKTFDQPPTPSPVPRPVNPPATAGASARNERREPVMPAAQPIPSEIQTMRREAQAEMVQTRDSSRYERRFDAPRYTTNAPEPEHESQTLARTAVNPALSRAPARSAEPRPLDFSRPVRLITTGQPVEIITTRARHPVYKVHAYIGDDDVVTVFTIDGRLSENGLPYLENAQDMEHVYLNIYFNRDGVSTDRFVITQHPNREAADNEAAVYAKKGKGERIKCVDVELDA